MEKRQHERTNKQLRMECSKRKSPYSIAAPSDNISEGGLQITENTAWDVGDIIIIHFRSGGKAKARVVRVQDGADFKKRIFGLQFLKIDKKIIKKIKKIVKKDRKKKAKKANREGLQ